MPTDLPRSSRRALRGNFGLPAAAAKLLSDCGLGVSLCGLCVLCGYLFCPQIAAAVSQEVVPVEGAAFQGELVSIADGRATFRVAEHRGKVGENKVVALDQLV